MMTWNQFKEFVDQKITAAGHDGSLPVEYIKYFTDGRHNVEVLIGREVDEQKLQVWNC